MVRRTLAIGSGLGALALAVVLLVQVVIGSAGVTESARYESSGAIDLTICHVPPAGEGAPQILTLPESEALFHLDEHELDRLGACDGDGELTEVGGDPLPASLTIVKRTTTVSGEGFAFESTLGDFTLSDGESISFSPVAVGSIGVGEVDVGEGWELQSIVCDGDAIRSGSSVSLALVAGDAVTCTFINAALGGVTPVAGAPIPDVPLAEPPTLLPNTGGGGAAATGNGGVSLVLWLGLGILVAMTAALAGSGAMGRLRRGSTDRS